MNIDILNAHCGPGILSKGHACLRVVRKRTLRVRHYTCAAREETHDGQTTRGIFQRTSHCGRLTVALSRWPSVTMDSLETDWRFIRLFRQHLISSRTHSKWVGFTAQLHRRTNVEKAENERTVHLVSARNSRVPGN